MQVKTLKDTPSQSFCVSGDLAAILLQSIFRCNCCRRLLLPLSWYHVTAKAKVCTDLPKVKRQRAKHWLCVVHVRAVLCAANFLYMPELLVRVVGLKTFPQQSFKAQPQMENTTQSQALRWQQLWRVLFKWNYGVSDQFTLKTMSKCKGN